MCIFVESYTKLLFYIMAVTIAIVNNKGGVGKTTTVANLGYAWARSGKRVLLVDLDSQANLTTLVDTIPIDEHNRIIYDSLIDRQAPPIDKVETNLDIIPSGLTLSSYEKDSVKDNLWIYSLKDVLAFVKDKYDIIILDCPPALGSITYTALVAADFFLLIGTPDSMSYAGMKMILTLAADIKKNPRLNPELKLLGGMLTKARPKEKVDNLFIRRIREELGEKHFIPIVISDETAVKQSAACGVNIFDYKPDSKAAVSYKEISDLLSKRIVERLKEK